MILYLTVNIYEHVIVCVYVCEVNARTPSGLFDRAGRVFCTLVAQYVAAHTILIKHLRFCDTCDRPTDRPTNKTNASKRWNVFVSYIIIENKSSVK